MSLFDNLGSRQPTPQRTQQPHQQMSPMQALNDLKRNPSAFLKHAGLDVPENLTDPQQIINHLLRSGQVSNSKLQAAMQMIGRR